MEPSSGTRHHLVLVGGGHSHVEVLREWARQPSPGVRLTAVVDRPMAVYSGMVPGFDDIELDVHGLARKA